MMSIASIFEPTSPVSDESFELITSAHSDDGGFESDDSLAFGDVVVSPNLRSSSLSLEHREAPDNSGATDDREGGTPTRTVSISLPSPERVASASSHDPILSSLVVSRALPTLSAKDAVQPAPVLFPAVEEEESRATSPLPDVAPALPTTAAAPSASPIDQSMLEVQGSPYVNGMPALLVTAEYPTKAKVLDKLNRVYPKRMRKLETKIAGARSSPSLSIIKKKKAVSLEQLLARKVALEAQIRRYTEAALLECQAAISSPHLHTRLATTATIPSVFPVTTSAVAADDDLPPDVAPSSVPVSSNPAVGTGNWPMFGATDVQTASSLQNIPTVLLTAEYPTKLKVLNKLHRLFPKQMRKLEINIERACSSPSLSITKKKTVLSLDQLLARKELLEMQILKYMDAAVLDCEAAIASDASSHVPETPSYPDAPAAPPSGAESGYISEEAAHVEATQMNALQRPSSVMATTSPICANKEADTAMTAAGVSSSLSTPFVLVIPECLQDMEDPEKTKVLHVFKRYQKSLDQYDRKIKALQTVSPSSGTPAPSLGKTPGNLAFLIKRQASLEKEIRDYADAVEAQCERIDMARASGDSTQLPLSPGQARSSGLLARFVFAVPDVLLSSDYAEKPTDLRKVEKLRKTMRDLDAYIFSADLLPPSFAAPFVRPLEGLLTKKRGLIAEINDFVAAASARAGVAVVPPPTAADLAPTTSHIMSNNTPPRAVQAVSAPAIIASTDGSTHFISPFSSSYLVIPETLQHAEYKKKEETLRRLEVYISQLRPVLAQLADASSTGPPSRIEQLQQERGAIETAMSGIIRAALKRADPVFMLAKQQKKEARLARRKDAARLERDNLLLRNRT